MSKLFPPMMVALAVAGCAFDAVPVSRAILGGQIAPAAKQTPADLEHDRTASDVRAERARLEQGTGEDADLSVLRFELVNGGAKTVTDLVLEVTVADGAAARDADGSRRILAGPLAIQSALVLEPGMSVSFEMRVKNLPAGCECLPKVAVQSARAMP